MPGMQRRVTDLASGEAVRHLRYVPRILRRVRRPLPFLLSYMRLTDPSVTLSR